METLGRETAMLALLMVAAGATAEQAWGRARIIGEQLAGQPAEKPLTFEKLREIQRALRPGDL